MNAAAWGEGARRGALRRNAGLLLFALVLTGFLGGTVWAQAVSVAAAPSGGVHAAVSGGWHSVAHWVLQPWATIALLVAGSLLLYHDLLTPQNWGVTGTLGVLSVGMVFAAQVAAGGVGWLGVILLLIGLAAVLLEIHRFPGHGSALGGFMLMFAGMFLSLGGTRNIAFALTTTSVLTVVFGFAFLAYLPKSPAWKRVGMQLHRQSLLVHSHDDAPAHFVGQTGKSLTELRPAGLAEIGGEKMPVVTEGEFLQAGTPLVVTHLAQGRIVVHQSGPVIQAVGSSSRAA